MLKNYRTIVAKIVIANEAKVSSFTKSWHSTAHVSAYARVTLAPGTIIYELEDSAEWLVLLRKSRKEGQERSHGSTTSSMEKLLNR